MAASFLKQPLLAIDPAESRVLAEAVANVAQHYPILEAVGDKSLAWGQLAAAVASVYGPRVVAATVLKRQAPAPAAEPAPAFAMAA